MKISLISYGTRGDVQPYLTLAWTLARRGHAVRLLAPRNLCAWAARSGVPCHPLPLDTQALFQAEEGRRMLAAGRVVSFLRWLHRAERAYVDSLHEALIAGCADADALVTHVLLQDRAAALGAALRIPVLPMSMFPFAATTTMPTPFFALRSLGPLNRLSHRALQAMLWLNVRAHVHSLRARLRLPRSVTPFSVWLERSRAPQLLAYSAHIAPRPADWGPHLHIIGALGMPTTLRQAMGEATLPPGLSDWLAAGRPPVYFGFGSMPVLRGQAMVDLVVRNLRRLGERGVLATGWSGGAVMGHDDRLFALHEVDHDQLLPRCAVAVHHGGSGTVHASLAHGCPNVVASVFADQPFWGARVGALGVGATLPFSALGGPDADDALYRSLTAALRVPARLRAQSLAQELASEAPLQAAVRVVEDELPRAPLPA
jgi:UDP:flavonoid glycosyltransferase YjiC (YdhE family)